MTRVDLPIDELAVRYERGESTTALGRAYGVSQITAWRHLHAAGVVLRPRGPSVGSKHGRKRGGPLHATSRGYLGTRDRDGKKRFIHRACWEAHNGPVLRGYVVHHINGDQLDNRIGNLACMTQREHALRHLAGEL